jgi:pyruvate,water dikinase
MAVLVQRQLDIEMGGVLFGIDPMSGDRDHVVVEVVPASVDDLVSGKVTAALYVLSRLGRIVERARAGAAPALTASLRRRLARLARDASAALGPAQDIEWAVDRDDRLWLLQSRPVTAVAERPGSARVFGPGPLAETFPRPLRRLEEDLWVVPLCDGIERALRASGAVSNADLDDSPIVFTVGGWAAMDLELTGIVAGTWTLRRRFNPVQILRRLATSWRVGRLRVALPQLAEDVLAAVDIDLNRIPPVDQLEPKAVLELLERARRELATVHQYEVLAGMLLHHETGSVPATLVALEALHEARRRGLPDSEAIGRWPVLLSLTPASLSSPELPPSAPAPGRGEHDVEALDEREALRLRSRWLQELLAVAARSLAHRLAETGTIAEAGLVRELTLNELSNAVRTDTTPDDLEQRRAADDGAPLPSRFRLTASGGVVPTDGARDATSGLPAAPGRVVGRARHRVAPGSPKGGIVLVTQHLDPSLAPVLPSLDGLVSETGSALSHLAILAREIGVPAVVGVDGARRRFSPGTHLLVDGSVGDVHELPEDGPAADGEAIP